MQSSQRLHFAYWSDPLCIWAFVAQAKLDAILSADDGPDERLDVDYHVVPVFGSVPQRLRGPWSEGGLEKRMMGMRKVAAAHGHPEVTAQVWVDDPPASSWSSGAAVKAAFELAKRGDVPVARAVNYLNQMRSRLFVDNRNIARRSEQLIVAEQANIPRRLMEDLLDDGTAAALIFEDHELRQSQQIQGSPTYVFDGGRARLYGNFNFEILRATVDELAKGMDPGCTNC